VAQFVQERPGSLVMFKPAMGHIFQEYLVNYTHWTYCDADQLFGHLPRLVTQDELDGFDIVTYTFEGDVARFHLRGQWTLQRNSPAMRTLFRKCDILSRRLLQIVATGMWLSGEGCISVAALQEPGIRVKFAPKMFTDHRSSGLLAAWTSVPRRQSSLPCCLRQSGSRQQDVRPMACLRGAKLAQD